jgi:hypothetical protein
MPDFTAVPSPAPTTSQRISVVATSRSSPISVWKIVGGMLALQCASLALAAPPSAHRLPPPVAERSIVMELNELFLPDRGDSIALTMRGRQQLDALARDLLQSSGDVAGVTLTGHVDRCGTDGYTLFLSFARAETARRYLREHAVPQPVAIAGPGDDERVQTRAAVGGCHARGSGLRVLVRLRD